MAAFRGMLCALEQRLQHRKQFVSTLSARILQPLRQDGFGTLQLSPGSRRRKNKCIDPTFPADAGKNTVLSCFREVFSPGSGTNCQGLVSFASPDSVQN